jgi:hypothetical protein
VVGVVNVNAFTAFIERTLWQCGSFFRDRKSFDSGNTNLAFSSLCAFESKVATDSNTDVSVNVENQASRHSIIDFLFVFATMLEETVCAVIFYTITLVNSTTVDSIGVSTPSP